MLIKINWSKQDRRNYPPCVGSYLKKKQQWVYLSRGKQSYLFIPTSLRIVLEIIYSKYLIDYSGEMSNLATLRFVYFLIVPKGLHRGQDGQSID